MLLLRKKILRFNNSPFMTKALTEKHVRQVILSIDGSKATPVADIPEDMFKHSCRHA